MTDHMRAPDSPEKIALPAAPCRRRLDLPLKIKLNLIFGLTLAVVCALWTTIHYHRQKSAMFEVIDTTLLLAARMAQAHLPPDYHDRLLAPDSMAVEVFEQIVAQNNQLSLDLDLQYLWSVMVVDGQVVFTASTSPGKDVSRGDHARFFEVHRDPASFQAAFDTMVPDFDTFSNEWGRGRQALLPGVDALGRPYAFGASMSLESVYARLRAMLWQSLLTSAAILVAGLMVSALLSNSIAGPIARLTQAAHQIADGDYRQDIEETGWAEVSQLSNTINRMSHTIATTIADLAQSEERFRRFTATANIGMGMGTLDGNPVYTNAALLRMVGESHPATFLSRNVFDYYPPGEAQRLREEILPTVMAQGQWMGEIELRTVLGEPVPTEQNIFLIHDAQGQPALFGNMLTDISQRKQAESALRDSEERHRRFFEDSRDALLVLDAENYRMLTANPAAAQLFGVPDPSAFPKLSPSALSPDRQPDGQLSAVKGQAITEQALEHGAHSFEWVHRRLDGVCFPCSVLLSPLRIGGRALLQATVRDITQQKRAQKALSHRVTMEAFMATFSTQCITLTASKLDTVLNEALMGIGQLTGADRSYIFLIDERSDTVSNTHEWCAPCVTPQQLRLQNIPCRTLPWWMERLRRREIIYIPDVSAMPTDAGAEKAILESQDVHSLIVVPVAWQQRTQGFLGLDSVSRGQGLTDEDRQALETLGNTVALVMERLEIEATLKDERSLLRTVINNLPDCIFMKDLETRKALTNRADMEVMGLTDESEAIGKTDFELYPPKLAEAFHQHDLAVLRSGLPILNREACLARDKGQEKWLLLSKWPLRDGQGRMIGIVGIGRDITEQKQVEHERQRAEEQRRLLERHLRQTQKMEDLGVLAGGIAHDFNNILYVILGHARLAMRDAADHPRLTASLQEIHTAGARGADLVNQILTFSRQSEQERRPVRVGHIVEEAVRFLRDLLPQDIRFAIDLEEGDDCVLGDPAQIHQAVMNLCANAWQAMRQTGGVLGLTLRPTAIPDPAAPEIHPALPPGQYLELAVSDTGHGIDEATLERVFEPFFTTREADGGNGMGLAIVHGIMAGHGGAVTVQSAPGQGACFRLCFPLHAPDPGALPQSVKTQTADPRGDERILLVDDDPLVLNMVQQSLEELGYVVTAMRDSRNAWEMVQMDPGAFDCVVTDQNMPEMTGLELARAIQELPRLQNSDSHLPVILCSGYAESFFTQDNWQTYVGMFIRKPIEVEDLAAMIRRLLDNNVGQDTG